MMNLILTTTRKKSLRFVLLVCICFWFMVMNFCKFPFKFPSDGQYGFTRYSNTSSNRNTTADLCSGRYVYIHNVPIRFNTDILENCSSLLKWPKSNMCDAIMNMGIGPLIVKPNNVLQGNSWFVTHPNLLEVIFHHRMKQYRCLTDDSSLATLIYVPFYAGLDLGRYLWGYNTSVRDSGPIDLLKWLIEKPEWRKSWGKDHFFVVGRTTWDFRRLPNSDPDWGNNLMYLPQVKNMTILSIESSPWIYRDFSIPYPTHFHPSNDVDVFEWQNEMRKRKRPYLFSFVGGPRPKQRDSIRGEIIDQCIAAKTSCKWLECNSSLNCDDPVYVMKILERSKFCLQPRGDTATRRSMFDSILAGCVPVFFSVDTAYKQYLWHLHNNGTEYSVYVPEGEVKNGTINIEKRLSMISKEEVNAMRERVISLIPNIMYANPLSSLDTVEDAFDITMKGVLERVTTSKGMKD